MTAQSTALTVNRPTRIEGIVIRRASTTVPSAVSQRTTGSEGDGFRPISSARPAGIMVRLAPVSNTIGLATLPLNVALTQNTPPSLRRSTASLITDCSIRSSNLTFAANWADGPSFGFVLDARPSASRASLTAASSASSA